MNATVVKRVRTCVENIVIGSGREVSMSIRKRTIEGQPLLLSISDVAFQLGVCRQTVYTYIYREGLPSIKVRGIRRVHPDSLHSWLREREQQTA